MTLNDIIQDFHGLETELAQLENAMAYFPVVSITCTKLANWSRATISFSGSATTKPNGNARLAIEVGWVYSVYRVDGAYTIDWVCWVVASIALIALIASIALMASTRSIGFVGSVGSVVLIAFIVSIA